MDESFGATNQFVKLDGGGATGLLGNKPTASSVRSQYAAGSLPMGTVNIILLSVQSVNIGQLFAWLAPCGLRELPAPLRAGMQNESNQLGRLVGNRARLAVGKRIFRAIIPNAPMKGIDIKWKNGTIFLADENALCCLQSVENLAWQTIRGAL